MYKNLRWKGLVILAVCVASGAAIYFKQIRLGLDLRGGMHLELQVKTDEALRLETETAADQLRVALQEAGIPNVTAKVTGLGEFTIDGIPPDQDAKARPIAEQQTGQSYDRSSAPGGYTFKMRSNVMNQTRAASVQQAIQTIDRRVNEMGVSEPFVAQSGTSGDRVTVQLPGLKDPEHAKSLIQNTALLEIKLVEAGPAVDEKTLLAAYNGTKPADMDVVSGTGDRGSGEEFFLVHHVPAVTGKDLRTAGAALGDYNEPAVSFTLNREGVAKFSKVTAANIGKRLAIVLDGRVRSAPNIQTAIPSENARITGTFTQQEVNDLSLILRSGALPAPLTYLYSQEVGPSLGSDSVREGVIASAVGLGLVAIFMLMYYRLAGINALLSVGMNLLILLGFMAQVGAVMTLPGIAGFILTIGMGVDSNVLIFERIREELLLKKGVRQAISAGFDRVFVTIVDTHVTSLIAAAFLFQFGTGPIRGFATTLFFGLVSNVFTSVFVSRTLFEFILSRRPAGATTLSI